MLFQAKCSGNLKSRENRGKNIARCYLRAFASFIFPALITIANERLPLNQNWLDRRVYGRRNVPRSRRGCVYICT